MLLLMADADNDWAYDGDVVESDGGCAAGAGDDIGDALMVKIVLMTLITDTLVYIYKKSYKNKRLYRFIFC